MKEKLRELPSVDEILKSEQGKVWLAGHPRPYVLEAIRRAIEARRKALLEGAEAELSVEAMAPEIECTLAGLSAMSLKPVINATGIVIHTNLGRSALPLARLKTYCAWQAATRIWSMTLQRESAASATRTSSACSARSPAPKTASW